MKFEDDADLGLVFHWKKEPSVNIFIIDDEVVGLTMKPEIFLIEINCIFTSWNSQIYFIQCDKGLPAKRTNFSLLKNLLVD